MKKLPLSFYRRENVLTIARELMGKIVITNIAGIITSGRIVECEAYAGITDRASHAYGGRRTARNESMYQSGGISYVYLCYGIHQMLNVVTDGRDIPQAILIRALEPIEGIEDMLRRCGKKELDNTLTRGPGNLSKALGIQKTLDGLPLNGDQLFLADDGFIFPGELIVQSPRIGVDYAGEDAQLPYRFYIKGHRYVSAKPR